ncbi:hypothetical protein GLOIN_2v1791234 [Rhizophagus irregularis DAOM 181602=DAOM 197198]|uniref:Uncharacterized protein n=2 Tax=Rhizophagus irregularis TaxID=588596 RepID=A0A2P4NXG9_RHIID|nr:hypothetical protein GLOIN_2v1791234 [Rhizophagus irregularis DAOM 181602=DAOM 197198]POG57842.1 hypothetical protein GLOIN_2v1791234 [Rhizophagus irregularis DAOM 181602=DAOM 197198]|eukprot:XP_025164708.1 hypothetical protein GLOIN_2v1791234 [Rhizophagus irregularis DAOM 181602=DAOM 197198]
MPRRKKSSKAAKKRFNEQDDDYIPSSEYSEDSSDDEFINERIQKLSDFTLIWSKNAHNKIKKTYTGNSRATKFRKYGPSGKFTQAAKLSQPITNFFNFDNMEIEKESEEKSEDEMEIEKESEKENEEKEMEFEKESEKESKEEKMEFENKSEEENKEGEMEFEKESEEESEEEEMEFENKSENKSEKEVEEEIETEKESEEENASLQSAKKIYNKGIYKARQIRNWAKNWIQFGVLPRSLQGCHQKIKSFIDDEDVIEKSLSFIRENGGKTTPKEYQTFINQVLFIQMNLQTSKRSISIKTSQNIIEYKKVFLNKMLQYKNFMPSFESENMIQQNPSLLPNEKMHILVTYDEYLFYSNDDRPIIWAPIGNPPLRKKGQGKSIMVSKFLLKIIGRLKLSEEEIILNPNVPIEARKFLKPGKNEEGWWTAEHLLDQVINYAIPIFEVKYPNCIGIFPFNNNTNHGAMAKDA